MVPVRALQWGKPWIVAHRGGAGEAPENSMKAFQYAWNLGIIHMETDVHVTSDGAVVVHHDPVVRTQNGQIVPISDLKEKEIRSALGAKGEPIPLLSEVLEELPGAFWSIDAKVEDVVDPLMEVLDLHRAWDRVLITSFTESRLQRVRISRPGVATTSLGTAGIARLVLAAKCGSKAQSWGVPTPRDGVIAVQVPMTRYGVPIINERFVATAHEANLAVHAWTIDDLDLMPVLAGWGVDGIITDVPNEAIKVFGE